jgi:Fuc2NAc and GlcNAc transferase
MWIDNAIAIAAAFSMSAFLTSFIRKAALARGVLDVPNSRSSHSRPTPRGGGLAIALTMLAAVGTMYLRREVSFALAGSLFVGGAIVASIGFLDDLRSVSVVARLAAHAAAFVWCTWLLGSLPPIDFGIWVWNPGVVGAVFAVIFLVWFLNLYNFMDGIDGIAGVEAISVSTIAAVLVAWRGGDPSTMLLLLLLAASVGGFLFWNWPPARIFMGDAGSGFSGFCLGSIGWATVASRRLTVWVWLILLGVFIVDATVTLLRRWGRGARLSQAHRSHAYQRLSRKYHSHLKVTLAVLCINVFWLGPLAFMAAERPFYAAILTLIAWTPLVLLAWRAGAGIDDN